MPKLAINKKIEARLKTIDISLQEIVEMVDSNPAGLLNINVFILKNCKDDIQKANFHTKEALRQLSYWEAKRGGRPVGFTPARKNKRGRYG
jgi:hypothetical protein